MSNIHVGDTWLTIRCVCTADLTLVTGQKIKYFDPDGKLGEWPAVVKAPATDGHIDYKILSVNDIYKAGSWRIWPEVTDGTDTTVGDRDVMTVYERGNPPVG